MKNILIKPDPKRFLIFWILSGFCQFPFIECILFNDARMLSQHPFISIGFYFLSVILIYFSLARGFRRFKGERLWARTFMVWYVFFPFFGWIITGTSFLGQSVYHKPYDFAENFDVSKSDDTDLHPNLTLFSSHGERIRQIYEEADVIPIVDIFRDGDLDHKRGAIDLLIQLKTPESIRILHEHKKDASPEVRFFVNAALTRIKKSYDSEINAAQQQMKEKHNDLNSRFHLAREYHRYASSGLLDCDTSNYYNKEAVEYLQIVCESQESSNIAHFMLIELLIELNSWKKAEKAVQNFKSTSTIDEKNRLEKLKAIIFFNQRKYQNLNESLKFVSSQSDKEHTWQASLNWWGFFK